jgi:hypothetical protein
MKFLAIIFRSVTGLSLFGDVSFSSFFFLEGIKELKELPSAALISAIL